LVPSSLTLNSFGMAGPGLAECAWNAAFTLSVTLCSGFPSVCIVSSVL
jgi:hypothetical protein